MRRSAPRHPPFVWLMRLYQLLLLALRLGQLPGHPPIHWFWDVIAAGSPPVPRHSVQPVTALPVRSRSTLERRKDRTTSLRDAVDRKSTRLNSSHSQISYAVF